MKRVILPIGILAAVSLFFLIFFLAKFDIDQYRPQVQGLLKNHLHQDVELGALSLKWKGIHPTVTASGVTFRNPATHQLLFQTEKAYAPINLSGILLHRIVISRLIFEGANFNLLRRETGDWNWDISEHKGSVFDLLSLAGWKIIIEAVEAPSAALYYADQSQLPYFHAEWHSLKLRISQRNSGTYHVELMPERGILKRLDVSFETSYELRVKADFGVYGAGEGEMVNPLQEARFKANLFLRNVELKTLWMTGTGSLEGEAFGEGLHPESFKRSLILKGKAEIKEGQFLISNFPGELLKSISPLPGFSNLTRQPFRGKFEEYSRSGGTAFKSLKAIGRLSEGKLFTENFEVNNPYYRIRADANLNLTENRLELKGDCFFKGEFAEQLVARAQDMDVLLNAQHEIAVPFLYKGDAEMIKPSADLFYIANRLIQIRGEQLASRGVQKINEFLGGYQR